MATATRQPRERRLRSEAHAMASFKPFVGNVMDLTGLDEGQATRAAVAVLGALEERLFGNEAAHLEAQLPSRLRGFIAAARQSAGRPPAGFHRDDLLFWVARELSVTEERAEHLARAVFATLANHVTSGELEDVLAQLPADLVALFPRANHR